MKLRWPQVETPTHIITMGLHESLDEAARRATKERIDYLVTMRGLSRDDAYMLTSAAVDLHVTQVVEAQRVCTQCCQSRSSNHRRIVLTWRA